MRKEFNKLANVLERYDLTEYGDELDIALKNLKDKIDEVEKRLKIVDKTAREIELAISKYTESVDGNEAFKMSVDNHDVILRGSHDIMITTDLGDDEPIKNDWYGMFNKEKKEKSDENFIPLKDEIDRYQVVEEIISKLKMIDVDGETMEYILNKVGMSEQMHSQLSKKFTLYDM
jgi:hypothetical protein